MWAPNARLGFYRRHVFQGSARFLIGDPSPTLAIPACETAYSWVNGILEPSFQVSAAARRCERIGAASSDLARRLDQGFRSA